MAAWVSTLELEQQRVRGIRERELEDAWSGMRWKSGETLEPNPPQGRNWRNL